MIYPYKPGSEGAKALSEATGMKRISHVNSKFKGAAHKLVLNWGASILPEEVEKCMVINKPEAIELASHKVKFFKALAGKVRMPEFTEDNIVAKAWSDEGIIVFARTSYKSCGGKDIDVLNTPEDFGNYFHHKVKFYTKYVPKKHEFRVHVFGGKVLAHRRKALSNDWKGNKNFLIRNHDNGFVFVKEGYDIPQDVVDQAIAAVEGIGLHFGAVDVIYNELQKKAYVLEVNTAPGLEGSTIDTYKEAIDGLFKEWNEAVKEDKIKGANIDFELAEILKNLKKEGAAVKAAPPIFQKPLYVIDDEDEEGEEEEDLFW